MTPDARSARVRDALALDRARLLYDHGRGGVFVTTVAAGLMVVMLRAQGVGPGGTIWGLLMALVLLARGIDLRLWRRRPPLSEGASALRRFSLGVLATVALWVAFPLCFFPAITMPGRAMAAIVLAAMAGGATTVLAPVLPVAILYCGALLGTASLMLLGAPSLEEHILGWLGLVDMAVLTKASIDANRSAVGALRHARQNALLLADVEQANAELTQAQLVLAELNAGLEQRIAQRTAALEQEIAERQRTAAALEQLATRDPLTGLLNRTSLVAHLSCMLADPGATPLALLFLDLDGFKQINDVQGHAAGDTVLGVAAERLRGLGGACAVCRWGGDEFVLIAPRTGPVAAEALGMELLRAIAAPIAIPGGALSLGGTIGVAIHPDHAGDGDALIRAADIAMYAGKQAGGNVVRLFDPALAQAVADRHKLEQDLRQAVADQALSLRYQPIVAQPRGACVALEALLRWHHPVQGEILPAVFIPIAEQSGLIGGIGHWVLRRACAEAMLWPGDAAVAVNASLAQLTSGVFPALVAAALAETGLAARRLHIEVTETLVGTSPGRVVPVLAELRQMGVYIALDDFGTGFSSLSRLLGWPIDAVKIDQSFVAAIATEGTAVIEATLLVAAAYGLRVVAEGVETQAQQATLRRLGVHQMQGFFFARPMDLPEAQAWLRAEEVERAQASAD